MTLFMLHINLINDIIQTLRDLSLHIICLYLRLHTVVGGPAGQLCSQVSCCGSGAAGPLHHTAQSARQVTCQTGPPVCAGGPEQDCVLLHHCTGTPGTAKQI